MLKWLVTSKERGDIVEDNNDDDDLYIVEDSVDNYNDDDDDLYRVPSYSSGYWSTASDDQDHTSISPDTVQTSIGPYWLQDTTIENDTTVYNLAAGGDEKIRKDKYFYENHKDDTSAALKKSKHSNDLRKLNYKSILFLQKQKRRKILKSLADYPKTWSNSQRSYIRNKEIPKTSLPRPFGQKPRQSQSSQDPLELSLNNLLENLPHQKIYPGYYYSPPWLLKDMDYQGHALYPPGTYLGSSDGGWSEEVPGLEDMKARNSYGVMFCKYFCFILLLTSFMFAIVFVSVFLSKSAGQGTKH